MRGIFLLYITILVGLIIGVALFFNIYSIDRLVTPYNINLLLLVCILVLICFIGALQLHERKKLIEFKKDKDKLLREIVEEKNSFETLFRNANIGVALLDLDGKFIRVNKALAELLGYSEAYLTAMSFYYLISPNETSIFKINAQQLIDNKLKIFRSEQQCFQRNGEILWIKTSLLLLRDHLSSPKNFILQVQNISEQKKAEESIRHMAYHDSLTGLANRNRLEQFTNHVLALARRHQQGFALLFLDLDRFKNINDTIGHEAGDTLLQIIAERLRNIVRTTDMVARLGGDEFVLLITDVKKTESVALVAQKILDNVLKVIVVNGQEIYITTSIGISLYPFDGQSMNTLMKNADLALYRAKEHGRNNYQFYTAEMTNKAQEKLTLQNMLAHALIKNEFLLHYQPKMEINTRLITGVEALLRWKNKDYGSITPDEIVSLAEETGLIIPVSDWILKTACKQLKSWHDMGFKNLTMAVNCSSRQFKQTTFTDELLAILTEVDLSPHSLEIEITESLIMDDPENVIRVLYVLKDLGVQIVIDDFGTGYWSLNHLRKLSVDKIKIDKSFIRQITQDETSAAITSAIIVMANKLKIISIAEGVETTEQYQFLAKEGCTEIQGYYLTHPLASANITNFLRHPIPDAEAITQNEFMKF